MLLELNVMVSSGKSTRAFNIKYLFLTDQAERVNLSIKYCPTDEMTTDHITNIKVGTNPL